MEINFNNNKKGSDCNYIVYDKKLKVLNKKFNAACHGKGYYNYFHNFYKIDLLFKVKKTNVSEEDFKKWIAFVNKAGFFCRYSGIKNIKDITEYSQIDCDCYVVSIFKSKMTCSLQIFTTLTVIRMISYDLNYFNSEDIVSRACELRKNLPQTIDNTKCIILAHTISSDNGHSLFSLNYDNCNFKLFGKKELINEYKIRESINGIFYKGNSDIKEINKIIKEKNWKELKKLICKKN